MPVVAAALLAGACGGSGGGPAPAAGRDGPGGGGPLVATAHDRGSFSVSCPYSHSAPDDPIVHHGHGHMSHHHDFFGATTTDAHATAASLLAGDTTCQSVTDHSAYWAPALRAGGEPVTPTRVVAYYRVPVGADARSVEPLPNGLEMIAGDATATGEQAPSVARWQCGPAGEPSPVPRHCDPLGPPLQLTLTFPPCWDGENLGSPDHRSHLARPVEDGTPGSATTGTAPPGAPAVRCPAGHPVMLPEVTLEVRYPSLVPPGDLSLASGPATGGHGDVLVAWDEDHLAAEVATCLRANARCDAP